jgi:hypothetical protein
LSARNLLAQYTLHSENASALDALAFGEADFAPFFAGDRKALPLLVLSRMLRQRAPLAPGYLSNFKAAHHTTQLYEIKSLYAI